MQCCLSLSWLNLQIAKSPARRLGGGGGGEEAFKLFQVKWATLMSLGLLSWVIFVPWSSLGAAHSSQVSWMPHAVSHGSQAGISDSVWGITHPLGRWVPSLHIPAAHWPAVPELCREQRVLLTSAPFAQNGIISEYVGTFSVHATGVHTPSCFM